MVTKTGKAAAADDHITVARLKEILSHIEWQCHLARLALHQLDATTKIKLTDEMKQFLQAEPPAAKYADPPC